MPRRAWNPKLPHPPQRARMNSRQHVYWQALGARGLLRWLREERPLPGARRSGPHTTPERFPENPRSRPRWPRDDPRAPHRASNTVQEASKEGPRLPRQDPETTHEGPERPLKQPGELGHAGRRQKPPGGFRSGLVNSRLGNPMSRSERFTFSFGSREEMRESAGGLRALGRTPCPRLGMPAGCARGSGEERRGRRTPSSRTAPPL